MKDDNRIKLHLTDDQLELLAPLFEEAAVASANKQPGIVAMQCFADGPARALFIPHQKAMLLVKGKRVSSLNGDPIEVQP